MDTTAYVFAGGATGGHLYPGLAVAQALQTLQPEAQITFLTSDRPLDTELLGRSGYRQIAQPVRPFTINPLRLPGFARSLYQSYRAAQRELRRLRPRAVLGLGGFAAVPGVLAACRLGIPSVVLNPDAVPGKANRLLGRLADLIVVQWESAAQHFAAPEKCRCWGCPIRPQFAHPDPAAARQKLGLDVDAPLLLVTGASQGARSINHTMHHVWPEFHLHHREWQLVHLTGPADAEQTRRVYAAVGAPAAVVDYAHEMWDLLAAADLVISRAGASTLAEITALGRPSILLPYPYHRDQHQLANARQLAERGAALVVTDRRSPEANCRPLLDTLDEAARPGALERMARAAARLGRADAAERVAGWLCAANR